MRVSGIILGNLFNIFPLFQAKNGGIIKVVHAVSARAPSLAGVERYSIRFVRRFNITRIMSSSVPLSSGSKKRAAASAVAATDTSESGTAHEGKRRTRDKEHDQKPSDDPHEKLAVSLEGKAEALATIEAAQRRVQMFSNYEEAARHDIRSRGEAEFDSLLVIGTDSISTILRHLQPKELCRSELVCKMFKLQSAEGWKLHDKKIRFNKSIVSQDPKTRFLRFFRSSEYAKLIETVADEHNWGEYMDLHDDIRIFRDAKDGAKESDLATYRYCGVLKQEMIPRNCSTIMQRESCPFPNHLTTLERIHKEAFVCVISRKNVRIFEGFCPVIFEGPIPHVNFRDIPCPGWPQMTNMLSKLDDEVNNRNVSGKSVIDDLRDSIGAMSVVCLTGQHKPKLVASVSDFRGDGGVYINHVERRGWISNEWGRISGGVALKPHEEIENKTRIPYVQIQFGWSSDRKNVGFRVLGGFWYL